MCRSILPECAGELLAAAKSEEFDMEYEIFWCDVGKFLSIAKGT